MTRRRGLAALLLVLGVLAGRPVTSAAAGSGSVTAVRLVETPALGHVVRVQLTTSGFGSGLDAPYVAISYQDLDSTGAVVGQLTASGRGDTAQTPQLLSPWTAAGRWQAVSLTVQDTSGSTTTYERGGSLDLSAVDFTITNPGQDVHAPSVTGFAPVWTSRTAGDPVAVVVRAADDRSGLSDALITYRSPSGAYDELQLDTASGGLGTSGFVSGLLPGNAESGTWTADVVSLRDRAGNSVLYLRDGGVSTVPSGATPTDGTAQPDWPSLDLQVAAAPAPDREPPALAGASLLTSKTVRAGDFPELALDVSDPSGVTSASATYVDGAGHEQLLSGWCQRQRNVGELLPRGLATGALQLQRITLEDGEHNRVEYDRDGTTRDGRGAVGRHELDLSRLDLDLVDGTGPGTYPGGRATCFPATAVALTAPAAALRGSTVPVDGKVTFGGQGVPGGVVAVYRTDVGGRPRVAGLLTAGSDGGYHGTVRLDTATTLRAQYLGAGLTPGALSPGATVRWKRGISLGGATSVGTTATFTTHVVPEVPGSRVLLEHLTSRGWDTAAIGTTDAHGRTTFRLAAPAGLTSYRAQAPADARLGHRDERRPPPATDLTARQT